MAIFNTVPPLKAGAGIKFDGETISTGAAPRNLLDNSDFRNPVNQRGKASYSLSAWGGYCIDRWAASEDGATVTIGSGGLTLSGGIYQPIARDVIARYNGKVLTFAVKIAGAVYCCSGEVNQTGAWHASGRLDTPYGHISFETEIDNKMFVIIVISTTPSVVEWAALYEGEYTAETLPEYNPKEYGAELLECLRYYYRSWKGKLLTADLYAVYAPVASRSVSISLPVPMRTIPTITLYNPTTGNSGVVGAWTDDADVSANVYHQTDGHFMIAGDIQAGFMYEVAYEASADL